MRDPYEDPHPAYIASMMADLTGAGMPPGSRAEPVGGDLEVERSCVHAGAGMAVLSRRSAAMDDLGAMAGEEIEVEIGSGNVFRDLGFADPEAELAKAEARLAAGERPKVREVTLEQLEAENEDPFAYLDMALAIIAEDGPDLPISIGCVWDAAQRLMAEAGPMPLVSSEPWVEGDEAYRNRLQAPAWIGNKVELDPDAVGVFLGLPRARLVPVQDGQTVEFKREEG